MKPNTPPKTPPYMNAVTHIANDIAREKSNENWIKNLGHSVMTKRDTPDKRKATAAVDDTMYAIPV